MIRNNEVKTFFRLLNHRVSQNVVACPVSLPLHFQKNFTYAGLFRCVVGKKQYIEQHFCARSRYSRSLHFSYFTEHVHSISALISNIFCSGQVNGVFFYFWVVILHKVAFNEASLIVLMRH